MAQAFSGRHDPTPAAAATFQAAALTHDLAAQAPACRRATVARARAILIAEERRHRAGLQAQRSALGALASDGRVWPERSRHSAGRVMTATPLSAVRHQCTRKVAYWDKRAAKAAQRHAEKTHGLKMHRYRCRFCDHWHLAKRKPI